MRWNNEEIDFLIKNSTKMNILEIAEKLNRTGNSVYKMCLKLKIDYINSGNSCTEWSKEDIQFLKNNYTDLSNAFLAKKLNKSPKQIITKIKKMNLDKERKNKDHLYFEQEEIVFIIDNWEKLNDEELANKLNQSFNPPRKRTVKTVSNYRKHILKINRPINSDLNKTGNFSWDEKEEKFLIDNFYNMSVFELSNHLNKTESSIKNKVQRLGLKNLNSKGINWTNENINFIRENFNELSINKIALKLQIPVEKILSKAIELNLVYEVKKLTNPELFIKEQLENLNINFEYQKNIKCNKRSTYRADFVIGNTIIEVQGDYYHCNPEIYKDGPIDSIQVNNVNKDKIKNYNLTNMGYCVYYIWENDINNNKKKVIDYLAALLSNK